jgi:hypothetical protein
MVYKNTFYKYLFILPIIIMIAFSLFFNRLTNEKQDNLLNEKFVEKKLAVAAIAHHADSFIEMDNNWEENYGYYKQSIIFDMRLFDTAYMTYAMAFDERLAPITKQVNYTGGFNPILYPSFREEVFENEMGDMIIHYKPKPLAGDEWDVHLHYRWVPTNKEMKDRILIVVGISKETLVTKIADWYNISSVALIIVTTLLNIAMVVVISRLASTPKTLKKK